MDKKDKQLKIDEIAWLNFYETGEIGAYLLYKELSKPEKNSNKTKNNKKINKK